MVCYTYGTYQKLSFWQLLPTAPKLSFSIKNGLGLIPSASHFQGEILPKSWMSSVELRKPGRNLLCRAWIKTVSDKMFPVPIFWIRKWDAPSSCSSPKCPCVVDAVVVRLSSTGFGHQGLPADVVQPWHECKPRGLAAARGPHDGRGASTRSCLLLCVTGDPFNSTMTSVFYKFNQFSCML